MGVQIDAIDISSWQRDVDFEAVRAAGIDHVILRCGFTGYGKAHTKNKDGYFEQNYAAAKAAGLHIGVYYYSCAVTEAEARAEADFVLQLIDGKQLELPVYWDTENDHDLTADGVFPQSQASIGREALTRVAKAFLERVEAAGYFVGLYASKYWLENRLDAQALGAYSVWVAQYAERCTYGGAYAAWQYTSTGAVSGVAGGVDRNYLYMDFPAVIRKAGLNRLVTPAAPEEPALLPGDVDGDGVVTAEDARLVLRASVGLESFTERQKKAADVDGDGVVSAEDARRVLRMAAGLEG